MRAPLTAWLAPLCQFNRCMKSENQELSNMINMMKGNLKVKMANKHEHCINIWCNNKGKVNEKQDALWVRGTDCVWIWSIRGNSSRRGGGGLLECRLKNSPSRGRLAGLLSRDLHITPTSHPPFFQPFLESYSISQFFGTTKISTFSSASTQF